MEILLLQAYCLLSLLNLGVPQWVGLDSPPYSGICTIFAK
jgi:hypothetical protein